MDPTTASYYRSILFNDASSQDPIPPVLLQLHKWAFKRCQNFGLNIISKQTALQVAMDWLGMTAEGRKFASEHTSIGGLLGGPDEDEAESEGDDGPGTDTLGTIDWAKIEPESPVTVIVEQKPTIAKYLRRRSSWVDVLLPGETEPRTFRTGEVHAAEVAATSGA